MPGLLQFNTQPGKTSPMSDLEEKSPPKSRNSSNNAGKGKDEAGYQQHELKSKPMKQPEPTILAFFKKSDKHKLDEIATQPSVFDNPEEARYHQPTAQYENLHRFDPSFRWTWREEMVSDHVQDHTQSAMANVSSYRA